MFNQQYVCYDVSYHLGLDPVFGIENNNSIEQPVHSHSLISIFVICFLEIIISKLAESVILFLLVLVSKENGLAL